MSSKPGLGIWSCALLLLLWGGGRTLHAAQVPPASPPVARTAVASPGEAVDLDDVAMDDEGGDPDDESPAQRIDELYEEGTEALDEEHWDEAIHAFDEVARLGGGDRADGALYWKAYAQRRSGRKGEALSTIATLRRTAPKSKWMKEAQVLEMEMRQDSGEKPSPEGAVDEDTKLIALNSLLATHDSRALPMLEQFLSSRNSRKLRDKALFVLSQNESAAARALVADIARGQRNVDLQRSAIRYLGLFGGRESRDALRGIYSGPGADLDVKKAVLQAYMVSGDKDNTLQVARAETSPELRRAAIQQLGAMGAQTELWQLYGSETNVEVKKAILHGMFIGGGDDRLIELSRTEKDPELRRAVVRDLGLLGSSRTGPRLIELYREGDPEVRKEAIQGLFIQSNAAALVDLARSEKDPVWRKALVQRIGLMDSEDARRYVLELLK